MNNETQYLKIDIIENLFNVIKEKGEIKKNMDIFYSILFLCKFYEILKDITVLVNAQCLNSVPILLRSAVGILYDLKNIAETDSYLNRLAYTHAEDELKRIRILKKDKEYKLDQSILDENEKIFHEIKENIPKSQWKKVTEHEKINNIEKDELFYRIVYSNLSKEAHSNLVSLEKHFIKVVDQKITFIFDVNETDFDIDTLINILNIIIYEAVITVSKINTIDYLKLEKQLNEIYQKMEVK